jgi:hypothetical protein
MRVRKSRTGQTEPQNKSTRNRTENKMKTLKGRLVIDHVHLTHLMSFE